LQDIYKSELRLYRLRKEIKQNQLQQELFNSPRLPRMTARLNVYEPVISKAPGETIHHHNTISLAYIMWNGKVARLTPSFCMLDDGMQL
jgi:hypothetical protein